MKKLSFAVQAIMFFSCNFISCSGKDDLTVQKLIEKNMLEELNIPSVDSKEQHALRNLSDEEYYLDTYGNISIKKEKSISVHSFVYEDRHEMGIFIGTNLGEFGGKLIYKKFTYNDDDIEYTIFIDNIRGIINFKDNIYVLSGLAHMSDWGGNITKLKLLNGEWEIDYTKEINSSPEAYTIYKDTLYILTNAELLTYDGKNVKKLLETPHWSGLFPQTMYVNDEIVAIGLRGCVAVINRKDNKVKHYRLRDKP